MAAGWWASRRGPLRDKARAWIGTRVRLYGPVDERLEAALVRLYVSSTRAVADWCYHMTDADVLVWCEASPARVLRDGRVLVSPLPLPPRAFAAAVRAVHRRWDLLPAGWARRYPSVRHLILARLEVEAERHRYSRRASGLDLVSAALKFLIPPDEEAARQFADDDEREEARLSALRRAAIDVLEAEHDLRLLHVIDALASCPFAWLGDDGEAVDLADLVEANADDFQTLARLLEHAESDTPGELVLGGGAAATFTFTTIAPPFDRGQLYVGEWDGVAAFFGWEDCDGEPDPLHRFFVCVQARLPPNVALLEAEATLAATRFPDANRSFPTARQAIAYIEMHATNAEVAS